jgi:hypothetical protein
LALTPTEKQRRYRASLKLKKAASADVTESFLKTPIGEFLGDNFDFEDSLDALGFPNQAPLDQENATWRSESTLSYSGRPLIERLTWLAGVFLDGAQELHDKINRFKLAEIDARIAEVEADASSDPAVKALAICRLSDIRSKLDREFRRSFREIKVAGTSGT